MAQTNTNLMTDQIGTTKVIAASEATKPRTVPAVKRGSKKPVTVAAKVQSRKDGTAPDSGKKPATAKETKASLVLKKLRSVKGTTIAQLAEATGWQAHSVRGFLSAVVRKKLGLPLVSEIGRDGVRRYRIAEDAGQAG